MFIIWIAIIVIVILLLQKLPGKIGGQSDNSALDILNERFARGEINKKEYEEKKKILNNK